MYFSLAHEHRLDFKFAESKGRAVQKTDVSEVFGIDEYPALIGFVPEGMPDSKPFNDKYGYIQYTGAKKKEAISKWLRSLLNDMDVYEHNLQRNQQAYRTKQKQRQQEKTEKSSTTTFEGEAEEEEEHIVFLDEL